MKNLKKFFLLFLGSALFFSGPLFAHGKNDVEERSLESKDSWQETFDLNEKKKGKYNVMVTAQDQGGNVTTDGPFNIYVDPDSDLPVTIITNPLQNMRVAGNLNIVGICTDDDAVGKVQIRLDGNSPITVEGKDFWSYYLDTSDLEEGPHTIEAFGTDINGLDGKPVKVTWNLDRRQPVTEVTNLTLGQLVSGKIKIKGRVTDGNGIKSLFYSTDGGQHFTEAKLDKNKRKKEWNFEIPVDTRKVKDGPSVCWFKAKDMTGSEGMYSFFYFVDNAEPDVKILYPGTGDIVNGKIGLAGYAKDSVGLQKLTWKFGNERGSFDLIPGDPYWYTEIDTGKYSGNEEFSVTALDLAGNEVTVSRKIHLNQNNDKPKIQVLSPARDQLVGAGDIILLRGLATDDDGVESVSYRIDGMSEVTLGTTGAFSTFLGTGADFSDGKHTLTLYATDIYGVKSDVTEIKFTREKNSQTFLAENKTSVQIVSPAMGATFSKEGLLQVVVSSDSPVAAVEYSLDGGLNWTSMEGAAPYSAKMPLSQLPDGLVTIDVRASCENGEKSYAWSAIQKDSAPPEVSVIMPESMATINGRNTIAFLVKDQSRLVSAEYFSPDDSEKKSPVELSHGPLIVTDVGTLGQPLSDLMSFRFTDAAGNSTDLVKWDFLIDSNSDLPQSQISLPEEDSVITKDFTISGIVLDDDGKSTIYYKIDDGEFKKASEEPDNSFSIPQKLSDYTDNEHSVTVYGLDVNGVKGPEVTRKFKVSLSEPKGQVTEPEISKTEKGGVTIKGTAEDLNGIKTVYISVDNGNSYNEAIGEFGHEKTKVNWSYEFDSRVIPDGAHVVFLKIVDWYGIEGIYSSLINIDNTCPDLKLELPLDDSKSRGMVFFSGQTTDNIGLTDLYITVRSLEGKSVGAGLSKIPLVPGQIISQAVDFSSLQDGFYNIELTGIDAAQNVSRVSRNITLDRNTPAAEVSLLYPLNGEHVQGVFNIYGTASSEGKIAHVELYVDDKMLADSNLSEAGYYKFAVDPTMISDGKHKISSRAVLEDGSTILSNDQYLLYTAVGPWVTIDNFTYGDFAFDRPFIKGNAGYAISEEELLAAKSKDGTKEMRAVIKEKAVDCIEVSFDNGKSFKKVSTSGKWRYRVENEDIEDGYHFLLVRAVMKNGEKAITRVIVQVDKNKPELKLISPGEGGHYNQELEFSGLASDDVALRNVSLFLRKGDKSSYEVPAFIQGLYFDWQFWGATLFNVGVGLTFFDDNVKLQAQFGQFTQEQRDMFDKTNLRYGGNVFGGKILANVAYIPFGSFMGRDWDWLSANVALGANFSYFTESGAGKAQILSAVLGQLEFPRVTFEKQKLFRTISFYTEGQVWFIPSDVSGSSDTIKNVIPQVSFGMRVSVF